MYFKIPYECKHYLDICVIFQLLKWCFLSLIGSGNADKLITHLLILSNYLVVYSEVSIVLTHISPLPQAKPPAKRPQAKASSKKPQVPAKKGKGLKGKGRKGKKLQLKFHIDCRQPVEDGIMNAADFVRLVLNSG